MKNVDIFYFDIDGTILDEESQKVSDKTIFALNKLKDLGYKVAISTGRTKAALYTPNILSIFAWDGFVLANGGNVLDKDLNVIKSHLIEKDLIYQLEEVYPESIILEGDNNYMLNKPSDKMKNFLKEAINSIKPLEKYENQPILKIIIEDVNLIEDGFKNKMFENYDYHLSGNNLYEIFPKKSGKHLGIQLLNKHLNVNHYAYFGDGHNDLDPMLRANFSVAMENGVDSVKEIASYITKHSNNDGIHYALVKHKVIKE